MDGGQDRGERGKAQQSRANRSFPQGTKEEMGSHKKNASTMAWGHEADEVWGLRAGVAMYLRIKAIFSVS